MSTQQDTCEIEVSVVTGFEHTAAEDAKNRLPICSKISESRGHLSLFMPFEEVEQVKNLQSIDHMYVVMNHFPDFKFPDNEEHSLAQIADLVELVDWKIGLAVWKKFFSFEHDILSTPQSTWHSKLSSQRLHKEYAEKRNQLGNANSKNDPSTSMNSCGDAHNQNDKCSNFDTVEALQNAESNVKKEKIWNPLMPSFRATCYRSGKGMHKFGSPDAAVVFGSAIQDYFGWNVKMKQQDIEVVLFIVETHVYVTIALTRESLYRRNLNSFGPTTLRPTIAYNMLSMCKIKPNEVICDPMCGGGTIPIEAAINWPNAIHLCGDSHPLAVPRCAENIHLVNKKRTENDKKAIHIDLHQWDTTHLPLNDSSVDVFITDMPFGKRSGTKLSNWHLYPRTLTEMARVCKPNGGRACLLTHDKKCIIKTLKGLHKIWKWHSTTSINIGGLSAAVFFLYRTKEPISVLLNEQKTQ